MIPNTDPNWNSAADESGWFSFIIDRTPSALGARYYRVGKGTGRALVGSLQHMLRGARFSSRQAYTVDGPVARASTTRVGMTAFGEVQADWKWGPVTNAALWRFIAERSGAPMSDGMRQVSFDPVTLGYLNMLEDAAVNRRLNAYAVACAVWALYFTDKPWREYMALAQPAISVYREGHANAFVPPAWNTAPPMPSGPEAAIHMRWSLFETRPRDPNNPDAPTDRELQVQTAPGPMPRDPREPSPIFSGRNLAIAGALLGAGALAIGSARSGTTSRRRKK